MTGKNAAFYVNLAPEGVAAAFGENFEAFGFGMISPDLLAHSIGYWFLIQSRAHHLRGDRAALTSIKPPVRTPAQTVHHRMRVLQAES